MLSRAKNVAGTLEKLYITVHHVISVKCWPQTESS